MEGECEVRETKERQKFLSIPGDFYGNVNIHAYSEDYFQPGNKHRQSSFRIWTIFWIHSTPDEQGSGILTPGVCVHKWGEGCGRRKVLQNTCHSRNQQLVVRQGFDHRLRHMQAIKETASTTGCPLTCQQQDRQRKPCTNMHTYFHHRP